MPEYIGGHQFAIPDVNSLKTSNWSNAIGGVGWGPRGELYRVCYLNEATSVSAAVGQNVFIETATASVVTSDAAFSRAAAMVPFVVHVATESLMWAGRVVSAAVGQGFVIVQVGGPMTITFTGANSANASAQAAIFVPAGTSDHQSRSLGTAAFPLLGAYGRMAPGYATAQTTALVNVIPAPVFQV